jgi:protein involved in polysaccharide export with SLBB domain
MHKFTAILMTLSLGVGLAGCRDNPPVVYPTAITVTEEEPPLGAGDKLMVSVYNGSTEKSKAEYILDSSGEIDIPYIGSVPATGKLPAVLKREIQARLADGYLVNPVVSVTIIEINSRKISVSGQVQKTGTIKFTPGMTIIEAVALSGGLTPMARANALKVKRAVKDSSETYVIPYEMINEGKRPNFPMMPGDQVYVDTRTW